MWRSRRTPALAGVAALVVLLLIAGSGFLSQLDLGAGAGPYASANALIEVMPSAMAEPTQRADKGGGKGKCHGHGNCQGNED